MRWLTGLVTLVCVASSAHADDSRCKRGLDASAKGDMVRAHLLLSDCAGESEKVARTAAKKSLEAGDFAPVIVSIQPEGAAVTVTPLGESFASPHTVWLPFGTHVLEAAADGYESAKASLEITDRSRVPFPLRLRKLGEPTADSNIDFGESDAGQPVGGVVTVEDPKPQEHDSLIDERFTRAPDPVLEAAPKRSDRTWGWLTLAGGVGAVATGGVVQYAGESDAAFAGAFGLYAAGAIATGIAVYLLAR